MLVQLDIVGESPLMRDVIDPLRINAVMMVVWKKDEYGRCILEMVVDTVMMMVVVLSD